MDVHYQYITFKRLELDTSAKIIEIFFGSEGNAQCLQYFMKYCFTS